MRILIPLLAALIALVLVVSFFVVSGEQNAPAPTGPPPAEQPGDDASTDAETGGDNLAVGTSAEPTEPVVEADAPGESDAPASDVDPPGDADAPAADASDLPPLRVRGVDEQPEVALGSIDPDSGFKLRLGLNVYGAAVNRVQLTDYFTSVEQEDHYTLLNPITLPGTTDPYAFAYAANGVSVNGQYLRLDNAPWEVVESTPERAAFRLIVEDEAGDAVLELRRVYRLDADSYDIDLSQRLVNRSGGPLDVVFSQNAQGDLTGDDASYLGDRRQYVVGYVKPTRDPGRTRVYTENGFIGRQSVAGGNNVLWPRPGVISDAPDAELTWFASENRYFAVATHPRVAPEMIEQGPTPLSGVPDLEDVFPDVRTVVRPGAPGVNDAAVYFTLASEPVTLGPNQARRLDLGIFAGPRKESLFERQPYAAMNFEEMIRYELGCTWCTFQWLADALLWYLKLLYGQIVHLAGMGIGVFDWGVAIIILVATVRLLLHPITKRSQANMMKMSKQMAALQPELAKLKKKYKDDQKKQQQEMMKLYREKGVNPANALGCLPMLLQTPIWIALYAMLYFAIELRHEPAFYGVFQGIGSLFGGYWPFLADLAVSDRFIPLMESSENTILRLPIITLDYSAINILPPLMAVVMFLNMKFTQPPPPENETDEQKQQRRQQQIVMRIFPFLFPILLYSAPSGLTLYICASTAAGIVDSYLVRKHVRDMEAAGKLFEKKPRKQGGFMDRISKTIERKQQMMLEAQKQKASGGGSKASKSRKKR